MRVKIIIPEDPTNTSVVNADTGEPIDLCFAFTVSGVHTKVPKAVISVYNPIVGAVVDAEVEHFCPYCKQRTDADKGVDLPACTKEPTNRIPKAAE